MRSIVVGRALPFTTFDQVREFGPELQLYCSGCRREVVIDLDDECLRGKSFAGREHFRRGAMVQPWTAHPPRVCGGLTHISVRPPKECRIRPGQAILHRFI